MAKSRTNIKDDKDFLRGFSSKLRTLRTRPNIHGYEPYIDSETGESPQTRFHASPKKGRLFIGGNRSGKTVGGGAEIVMRARGEHRWLDVPKPPVRLRAVAVDVEQGIKKIIMPEVARWMPPSSLINGSWEDSYDLASRTLTLENGSFIEFMSYEQSVEKFAGTSRHGIWFDEEPPEEIFDECMQRLIDTGGSWWMTMTPVEGMTWVFDDIYERGMNGDADIDIIIVDSEMNPYVGAVERQFALSFLSDDEKKARKEGLFVHLGGLIYPMFKEEVHVIKPFVPPSNWLWFNGMDHGYNNPTAWLWAAIDPDGRIFVFDEHYESGKIVRYHAEQVHSINAKYQRIPDYNVGDPSIRNTDPITGTSVLIEYMELGIPIVLGNNDQKAGINKVSRYFLGQELDAGDGLLIRRPNLYITENCVNLIRELKRLRWATWSKKKDEKNKNKKEEQHKKDDHACDGLRYLISSRPDLRDDGSYIPQFELPNGVSGISGNVVKENVYDDDLINSRDTTWVDVTLGSDF